MCASEIEMVCEDLRHVASHKSYMPVVVNFLVNLNTCAATKYAGWLLVT